MEVKRINNYHDSRFSQKVLNQHGCFEIGEALFEVEIISNHEAIVRGTDSSLFEMVIESFRYYNPHIYLYYDEYQTRIKQYEKVLPFWISLKEIQPSQFYVDQEKVAAVSNFIQREEDIIVQVVKDKQRYIAVDGHTRLYYAAKYQFSKVKAILCEKEDYLDDFVKEAMKRGIQTPQDLILLPHLEYEKQWKQYCEQYFSKK